ESDEEPSRTRRLVPIHPQQAGNGPGRGRVMVEHASAVTEQDRAEARAEAGSIARNAALGGVALLAVTYFFTRALLRWIPPTVCVCGLAARGPAVWGGVRAPWRGAGARVAQNRGRDPGGAGGAGERQMRAEARRREFATRLAKALDMARTEPDALDATARA